MCPQNPHGASLSLRGPGMTKGIRVQPPLCGGGTYPCAHNRPWGAPIPPRPRHDRRDSGVTAAVWGRDLSLCPQNPHGASLSLRGPGMTGGIRVQPPLCGGRTSPCAPKAPRGVPIPPRPRQDRRDSGVTAAMWGRDLSMCPQTPTGRPYPSAAQA